VRVLKDHLHLAPELVGSRSAQPRDQLASISISPPDGSIKRASSRANVDFPDPDSPTIPTVSPFRTSRSMASMAFTAGLWRNQPPLSKTFES
jgi:hypothetical protein